MCDVCAQTNTDWKILNGNKPLSTAKLYCVYVGKVAKLTLCRVHSIELFQMGENRFLRSYLKLAIDLNNNKKKYSLSSNDDGFMDF